MKKACMFLLAFATGVNVVAETFYVSHSGNDTAPGTKEAPFIDGTVTTDDEAFKNQLTATYAGLAKKNRGMGKLQYYAFAMPLSAIGNPAEGTKIPFNVTVFSSAYRECRRLEGIGLTNLVF